MFNRDLRKVERRLRDERPAPSAELMRSLAPRRAKRPQFAFAGALTVALAISLSAVGGVSYAANAVNSVVKAAKQIVTPKSNHLVLTINGTNAGGDQYRPGYGWGDKNHIHTGPPGLAKGKPGEKAPPAQVKRLNSKAVTVSTSVTVDEQAALYFSVLDAQGKPLLLTQKGSAVGAGLNGPQTKSIHYVMLVPRTLSFQIRIPANLLVAGQTYSIRVIAVDADGNKTQTTIPFTA
ncbi:MAG: hypothetical protein QOH13_2231 [Thermoleophilaceae bacterium]|nr:hypothetical protein [Thermoleophilaceae bacterium]